MQPCSPRSAVCVGLGDTEPCHIPRVVRCSSWGRETPTTSTCACHRGRPQRGA